MERRVKERLIGATILVVLVVMFVPEFLSGPHAPVASGDAEPGASRRTYVVDDVHIATELPAPAGPATASTAPLSEPAPSAASPTPAATGAAATGAASPGSAAPGAAAPGAASLPAPPPVPGATPAPAATPAAPSRLVLPPRPAASPKPGAAPGTSPRAAPSPAAPAGWAVQAGSFASRANAERLAHELKSEGFGVYVAPIGAGANARYRVRVGPLPDRAAAAGVIAKLQAHQHASTLVPPSE